MKTRTTTLRDLFEVVNDVADSDEEAVATITHLLNRGAVRLGGRLLRVTVDTHTQRLVAA